MLDRSDEELLVLTCMFLKKLSIFKENVTDMLENDVIPRVVRFVASDNDVRRRFCSRKESSL